MTKETPLYSRHRRLGARMVEFAGFAMPMQYEGIQKEHAAVRHAAGLFDVSHMGEFVVRGRGAEAFLNYVLANDVRRLSPGQAQYSYIPNPEGGVKDDLLVYRLDAERFMLVVNAANIAKDWAWLVSQVHDFDVQLTDISDDTALLALQGPRAAEVLQPLADVDVAAVPFYRFRVGSVAGVPDVIISATGYTGAGGFELYVPAEAAPKVWDALMAGGGVTPAGLGARDILRLEMGYLLYGNDMDESTLALEAGLGWVTRFNKDFIGKTALWKAKQEGLRRRLRGLVITDRGIPRRGYPVTDAAHRPIGHVTSGGYSPLLQQGIALAYLPADFSTTDVFIQIRTKFVKAKVTRPPFIRQSKTQ